MNRFLIALVAALLVLLTPLATSTQPGPDRLDELVEEIRKQRESVDLEVLDELVGLGTREAAEAVIELYDSMGSVYMRLELLERLDAFDGVGEAEQVAMQKLMDVATTSEERELRSAALETLGRSENLGKTFLEMIVESAAEDEVREKAMDLHLERAEKADQAWYRKIYELEKDNEPEPEEPRKRRRRGDDDDDETEKKVKVHKLKSLREKALSAILSDLDEEELETALSDRYWGVRYLALEELARRDEERALMRAEEIYSNLEGRVELRALSARLLAAEEGPRIADRFIDDAEKFITPHALRMELADILAGFDDEKVNKELVRSVGRGKSYEKLFSLRAVRDIQDDRLDKKIWRLLADRDEEVRVAATRVVGRRGNPEAAKPLEKLIDKAKDSIVVGEAIDAMSQLRGDDPEWDAQLVEYAASEDTEIRNAAVLQIGRDGREAHFDVLETALGHPVWSTRYAALRGLEELREKRAIPLIIEQMKSESGRMEIEFAEVLFELTGKPYNKAVHSWEAWWENEGEGFEIISEKELEEARRAEELRRLKQITNVKFFGIRIVSHRVTFIIDVSGSMLEEMRARYVGGKASTRIEVAKKELKRCIDGLDREALFNIITFSNGVETWLEDGITGTDEASREEAKEYVERLGAGGGTNLYDSLRLAFDDPDVDTIFVLSDGEPTVGEYTDIGTIRDHVDAWNEHRGVVINTIGIGGDFQVLEWLAEDSGGTHIKLR